MSVALLRAVAFDATRRSRERDRRLRMTNVAYCLPPVRTTSGVAAPPAAASSAEG